MHSKTQMTLKRLKEDLLCSTIKLDRKVGLNVRNSTMLSILKKNG